MTNAVNKHQELKFEDSMQFAWSLPAKLKPVIKRVASGASVDIESEPFADDETATIAVRFWGTNEDRDGVIEVIKSSFPELVLKK
ncbi:hypothetical protein [Lacticaseibacillus sharpeae]|uniref:Uncharacterized protein n=1 Tax=Lacticaseibacillus sharpeae JCM 1186 = DSM 20505 TaxID=1291052 RepID=A0A0R1ZUZ7_9LACO|nr:hypothetical protein [Lacticaseibacillus sharpeae]KRM54604.1 hypothetical protein FC18_GL002312 [Lacticaseibacillus sharpeae JCM 1186 = DSM 20505]